MTDTVCGMGAIVRRMAWLALMLAGSAAAQTPGPFWRDQSGKPVKETEAMKSIDGFAASSVLTTDADWQAKWDTPEHTSPHFARADIIPYGKNVFLLTFFSNPSIDSAGYVRLRCDFKITNARQVVALEQKGLPYFTGKIAGSPYNLYLWAPVIEFAADPGDPPGIWVIDTTVSDEARKVTLALRTSFEVR